MASKDKIARVISTIFHPLLMPTLGIFLLFQLNTFMSFAVSTEARRFIFLIVFINTAIVPVLAVVILKRMGYIEDLILRDRGERILPLLISSALFFMTYYLLRQLSLPTLLYYYFMGATLLVLLTLMISFVWKISIHMVSLGGLTGFLIVTSLLLGINIAFLIALAFLASGLTAASRLQLKAHTPAQVYTGFATGVAVMLMLFVYLRT